jgi:hypothetical protein
LNVAAYGATPLRYQWFKDNAAIPVATNNVFTIPSLQLSNSGSYLAVVSNVYGSQTSSPAAVVALPWPDCAPISEGLISWWRMEKEINDNWGTAGPIVFANRGLTYTTGKVGQALSGQFLVADSPQFRPTNALSIEAWVLSTSPISFSRRTIVGKYETVEVGTRVNTNNSYFLGLNESGRLLFSISPDGSALASRNLTSPATLPIQEWQFVVATYDGSSMRLYLNGALVAQTNYTGGIFPGTLDLGIGAVRSGGEVSISSWTGFLDEVSIYRRALFPAEISSIYNAGISGKCLVPPTITTHPQNQTVPSGEDVKFTVDVLGTQPLRYQWRFYGTNLIGATNATLILEKLDVKRAGPYSVLVSNAVGSALSASATLALGPAPTCVDPPTNALSWWPVDASTLDVVGTNNLQFGSYATGKVKQALACNGVSSRFQIASPASLNFGSNADFSIEAWIKALPPAAQSSPSATNLNVPFIEKRTGTLLSSGVGYSFSLYRGRLAFWMGASAYQTNPASFFVSESPDLRDSFFHHVAVTLNRGLTNGGKLYLDGQLIHTFDPTPRRGSLTNSSSLYIGGPASTFSSAYFNGLIDEVAVYDRALSAAEILAIRSAGAAGKCKVPPSFISQPQPPLQEVTLGSNATFTVAATGGGTLRYQWLRNGALLTGANNSTYTFKVESASAGNYTVRVTNAFGVIISTNGVLRVNYPPEALPATVSILEDTPVSLTLRGSDPDDPTLTFTIVQPPTHGQLSGLVPNVVYTPATNFNGMDSFSFSVNDGLVTSPPRLVSINVAPLNDRPLASAQNLTISEDTTLPISLLATDSDGDPLAYELVELPTHGRLNGLPPMLTYIPATNYFGPDQFVFQARDSALASPSATVSITVNPVNDAPFAVAKVGPLLTLSTNDNGSLILSINNSNASVALDGSGSFDVENDPLTFSWFENGRLMAAGVVATNTFSVGLHTLGLQVADGAATGTTGVNFEVITAAMSINLMQVWIEDAGLATGQMQPLLASLRAAASALDRGALRAGLNQLATFQNKVNVQIAPTDPELARQLNEAAAVLIEQLNP